MIIDLGRFIEAEKPYWEELEKALAKMEDRGRKSWDLNGARRFHYLYERVSADLEKVNTFASEPELVSYLEGLVSRAYGEIHETRRGQRFDLFKWFTRTVPRAFRRHRLALGLSVGLTLLGTLLGALAVAWDAEAKDHLLPEIFANHRQSPSERVAAEEKIGAKSPARKLSASTMTQFSTELIQNNISVSLKAIGLGLSYGIGTMVMLFYNGLILGIVGFDYVQAGETVFLLGWLLPHGVVEIPAIVIAGQVGFILAGALIGWGSRAGLRSRLRLVMGDLVKLTFWVAVMLVWAGIVEAFLSQWHQPAIPYVLKITFGVLEGVLLFSYLFLCGRKGAGGEVERDKLEGEVEV